MPSVSAILTAAGESSRMGSPKPLLSWHGITLVEFQIDCLFKSGVSEVLVVLGHKASEVIPFIVGTKASYVVNPMYAAGKTTSIKAGLEAISSKATAVVLLAVDQPRTPAIVEKVVSTHVKNDAVITSPRYRGHGGHPLIFSSCLFPELENISEKNEGLREVFQNHLAEITEVCIDEPVIRLDLNTPEAYVKARAENNA